MTTPTVPVTADRLEQLAFENPGHAIVAYDGELLLCVGGVLYTAPMQRRAT